MKSHQILVLAFLLLAMGSCTSKNTTEFWGKVLNDTNIHFQSYCGYEYINWYYPENSAGIFYHLFGAAGHDVVNSSDIVPLIIWLQGGPGSSSQFGAFTEIGPIRIENGTPRHFENSWNMFGHLLFIDSPLNVGFSFSGDRKGDKQVSSTSEATDHLMNFLYEFYKDYPALKNCPLYIAG